MVVFLNDTSFTYDVHSLIKAFYPRDEVSVSEEGSVADASVIIDAHTVKININGTESSADISGLSRAEAKNILKLLIYDTLSETEGPLPWGTLTGIRPVKLLRRALDEGEDRDETFRRLREKYRISDEKLILAHEIAGHERRILEGLRRPGAYSLYIGIPFCPSICLYCSFSSYPLARYRDRVGKYLEALVSELRFVAGELRDNPPDSIYIGGGTPTSLSAGELSYLLGEISSLFDLSAVSEFTVEAGRPDSLNTDKLRAVREFGDIRLSINPQTMNEETLQLIGRNHSPDDVIRCFHEARELGFSDINMDIIVGLPGEGPKEAEHTLSEIEKLSPENLTVHSLAIKRSSRLNLEFDRYEESIVGNSDLIMQMVHKTAENLHMHPYYLYRQKNIAGNLENIGFAREGYDGIYNAAIMEEVQDIIACGAGAVSKRVYSEGAPFAAGEISNGATTGPDSLASRGITPRKNERAANIKDVDLYTAKIQEMIERKRVLFEG